MKAPGTQDKYYMQDGLRLDLQEWEAGENALWLIVKITLFQGPVCSSHEAAS